MFMCSYPSIIFSTVLLFLFPAAPLKAYRNWLTVFGTGVMTVSIPCTLYWPPRNLVAKDLTCLLVCTNKNIQMYCLKPSAIWLVLVVLDTTQSCHGYFLELMH